MAKIAHLQRFVNMDLVGDPAVAQLLHPEYLEQQCRQVGHHWRDTFWSPAVTFLAFLLQVLSAEKTLRKAVAAVCARLSALDPQRYPPPGDVDTRRNPPPSRDPSAYCQARKRLPEAVLHHVRRQVADRLEAGVRAADRWLGRRVWMLDGSSVSMPDTPKLQKAFPQPPSQAPGCGFPTAQVVALFSWATGAIQDIVIDQLRPHELSLARRLRHHFRPGDVVLGDRAYCNYVDVARGQGEGVDYVLRLHQRRKVDFRKGRRLGHDDRLVVWTHPEQWLPSCGMPYRQWCRLPETLDLRLIRITGGIPGFRCRTLHVVTTLRDPAEVPADAIRDLYRDRWMAELRLRDVKTTLGMEVLRGQSPDIVRKEIAMHLLIYNLVRMVMAEAARRHGRSWRRLSFAGALHRLREAFALAVLLSESRTQVLAGCLLAWIAEDVLPDRPNRMEPRRLKRRPKPFSIMVKPRAFYHAHGDPDAH